jgi:hypothetical protein
MAYRLYDPNPVFISLLGTEAAPDGTLTFYDKGTTTPKAIYSDEALTIANPNPLDLDAAGRAENEVWLDGEYTVVLKDADDTTIWTRDVVPEVAPGLALPDPVGHDGEAVFASGTGYVLGPIRQLPDPTGSAGYSVKVNGDATGYILVAPEAEPDPLVNVGANSVRIVSGGDDDWLIQIGTLSCPASGSNTASLAVTFPTPFKSGSVPSVSITPAPGTQPGGPAVAYLSAMPTASGFTAIFDVAEGNSVNQNITVAIAAQWRAEGPVVAA